MASSKPIPSFSIPQMQQFWSRAKQAPSGCWIWQGNCTNEGYGRYGNFYAHRIAYTVSAGPIPDGLTIDHLCRNRACVRPDHLEAVEAGVNVRRGLAVAESSAPSTIRPRQRGPARYHRRRERGVCVQCNTPSEKYRCARCGASHNERNKGRPR